MQETQTALRNIFLKPSNAERIALFVGELNGNLKLIEKSFSVKIFHKGDEVKITGNEKDIKHASDAILDLYNLPVLEESKNRQLLWDCFQNVIFHT